jgi:hypothetical protein
MLVAGYDAPGSRSLRATAQPTRRVRIQTAREVTIGPEWSENISGDISKSVPFVRRWLDGMRCENWEGLYAGDPIGDWSGTPIPWAQAVAHGKLVIAQQWGKRQGAAGATPGGPLPGFEKSYTVDRYIEAPGAALRFPLSKIAMVIFLPGDYPLENGVRKRPRHPFARSHGLRIPITGRGIVEWVMVEEAEWWISYTNLFPVWTGGASKGLGRWAAGDEEGKAWAYNPKTGKREEVEEITLRELARWRELKASWPGAIPRGGALENYAPSREDYVYKWVSTYTGHAVRFPLSLAGLKKLPTLDAKSKGWLIWGAMSEPAFTFEPNGLEKTGNEFESKICSELQMQGGIEGKVQAGEPQYGAAM